MEIIMEWWAVISAATLVIVWLSRLEWRGVRSQSDIRDMQKQREADLAAYQAQRATDLASASKARDETNKMLDEIRGDIKQLLQRGNR